MSETLLYRDIKCRICSLLAKDGYAIISTEFHLVVLNCVLCWQAESESEWRGRTPELIVLLAASSPQLRSLEH